MMSTAPHPDGEDPHQRLNREWIELLNELRVVLPGVQMLFGFLLAVPFTQRFAGVTGTQRTVYYVAFLAAAAASAFLIAPSAYHRLLWRHHDKERLLEIGTRLAILAIGSLAIAISAVIYVVTEELYGTGWAAVGAAVAAASFAWLWYGLPLLRRIKID